MHVVHASQPEIPWAQRADEPDSAYRAFLIWLHSSPRALPQAQAIALEYAWSSRALAYDQALATFELDPAKETIRLARQLAMLEMRKWRNEALSQPHMVSTKNELRQLWRLILEIDKQVAPEQGTTFDLNLEGATEDMIKALESIATARPARKAGS